MSSLESSRSYLSKWQTRQEVHQKVSLLSHFYRCSSETSFDSSELWLPCHVPEIQRSTEALGTTTVLRQQLLQEHPGFFLNLSKENQLQAFLYLQMSLSRCCFRYVERPSSIPVGGDASWRRLKTSEGIHPYAFRQQFNVTGPFTSEGIQSPQSAQREPTFRCRFCAILS